MIFPALTKTKSESEKIPMATIATAVPNIKTKLPGPNAQRVLEGDAKYLSPSYTRSYPLVAKRGQIGRAHV